jgi:hypothetical protein
MCCRVGRAVGVDTESIPRGREVDASQSSQHDGDVEDDPMGT